MITGTEVLQMLIPDGGWVIKGNEYEGIEFLECNPITKEEFEAGFAKVAELKAQEEADVIAKREAALSKLAALGLDTNDLKALGF